MIGAARRRMRQIAAGAVAAMLVLMVAELAVEHFGAAFYHNVVRLGDGGYGYRPGLRGAYLDIESNLLLRLASDDLGTRRGGAGTPIEATETPIVVAGNSYVDAREVRVEERFSDLLNRSLAASGRPVRVFNLGVQGQAIINHIDRIRHFDRLLAPKLVILGLTVGADFDDAAQITFRGGQELRYVATETGVELSTRELSRSELILRDIRSTFRGLWLGRILLQGKIQLGEWIVQGEAAGQRALCPGSLDPRQNRAPAFRLTEALVDELHERLGARLVVLLIPDDRQLRIAPGDRNCDLTKAEFWLAQRIAAKGIHVVSVLDDLRATTEQTYFPGGHLNPAGHRVIANVLARHVGPILEPAPP